MRISSSHCQMQMPNARGNQNSLPDQSWGPPPPAFPMNPGGHGYGPNPMHMPRPHQYDNYYPPVDMPTLDKQPRMGPPTYGRDVSMGAHITNVQPQQAVVAKVEFLCSDLHFNFLSFLYWFLSSVEYVSVFKYSLVLFRTFQEFVMFNCWKCLFGSLLVLLETYLFISKSA